MFFMQLTGTPAYECINYCGCRKRIQYICPPCGIPGRKYRKSIYGFIAYFLVNIFCTYMKMIFAGRQVCIFFIIIIIPIGPFLFKSFQPGLVLCFIFLFKKWSGIFKTKSIVFV